MPLYKFTTRLPDGSTKTDTAEVESKADIYKSARDAGARVLDIEPAKKSKDLNLKLPSFLARVKETEKIRLAKNLSAMLQAGLSLSRSLEVMAKQSKNPKFKSTIASIQSKIKAGDPFSKALEAEGKTFSQLFTSMVKAGEESGSLAQSLKIVGEQMEKTYILKKKVKGAFIYPAVIVSVMIVIGITMMVFVVPTLTATFEDVGVELPTSTKIVIGTSNLLKDHPLLMALGALVAAASIFAFLRTDKGHRFMDTVFLKLPVIKGITKEVNAARTTRTLSSLLHSGVDMVIGLQITKEVIQNSYYKEILATAEDVVQRGENLSEVFGKNEKYYPSFVAEMTNVGEETGQLSDMLQNVAVYYEREVEQKTKDLSTIIEPVLMVIVGIAVGFFAISMLTPMYSLVGSI